MTAPAPELPPTPLPLTSARTPKAREVYVDEEFGLTDARHDNRARELEHRIDNLVREMVGLAGDASTLKARLDELSVRFQNHEAVNLAAHTAAARRIVRLERSAWARTVAFLAHWWRVVRGRFGVTGTP